MSSSSQNKDLSYRLFCPKGICIVYQSIVYWTHFQNIHTSTYQETLLHTLLLLVSKIVESRQCILNVKSSTYYFRMKTKILADFQTCISIPLMENLTFCGKVLFYFVNMSQILWTWLHMTSKGVVIINSRYQGGRDLPVVPKPVVIITGLCWNYHIKGIPNTISRNKGELPKSNNQK